MNPKVPLNSPTPYVLVTLKVDQIDFMDYEIKVLPKGHGFKIS